MNDKLKTILYLCAFIVVGLLSFNIFITDSIKQDINYDIKYAVSTVLESIPIIYIYKQFDIVSKCINYSRINLWSKKLPIQQSNTYG